MSEDKPTITIADSETVDIHEGIVDELLEVMGFEEALVTDESKFLDFYIGNPESEPEEQKLKEYVKEHYDIDLDVRDYISDIAIQIYNKKKNSTMH